MITDQPSINCTYLATVWLGGVVVEVEWSPVRILAIALSGDLLWHVVHTHATKQYNFVPVPARGL